MEQPSRLAHFPIPFFAVVMGLAGLTIAWRKAEVVFQPAFSVSCVVLPLAVGAFMLLAFFYGLKLVRYPQGVLKELRHPVRLNFFPAISIGMLLLAIPLLDGSPDAARALWVGGAVLQLGFTLYVINAWIHHTHFEVAHVSPAWFIPVVGNVIVPIAGVKLYSPEISWFFFSIGLVFWPVLFTIIMYRLFFHAPLPERLTPTLFILIAPPAVGFLAYVNLTGGIDAFARVLYYIALLLTLLMASNALRFLRVKFFLSAWAYSFPLAAITTASMVMADQVGGAAFEWLSMALLALLTAVVTGLFFRTLLAIVRREICVEE